ncbi:MAG: hypothetical protein M3462_13605 [Chloroflexota bacterium]|nr:hypothetical protein [Chloroflexota bacterium]
MQRSRTGTLTVIAVLVLAGMGLVFGGPARAQDASQDHSVIGSWQLLAGAPEGQPEGDPTLATFSPDGSLVVSGRPVRPALPGLPFKFTYFSAGHGVWEASGEHAIDFTIVHVRTDEDGVYRGSTTVSGTLEIADDGQSLSGAETFTIGDPAGTGAVIPAFGFSLEGTRITLQPMADLGTPATG